MAGGKRRVNIIIVIVIKSLMIMTIAIYPLRVMHSPKRRQQHNMAMWLSKRRTYLRGIHLYVIMLLIAFIVVIDVGQGIIVSR